MSVQRPVLVGYDGSRTSRNALAYAAGLARRTHHPLMIVHVVSLYAEQDAADCRQATPGQDGDALARLRAEIGEIADTDGLTVHMTRAQGHRARALERVARHHHAEAIVLGAPRRRHRLLGSVPVRMLRAARCPIIIVP